MPDPNSLISQLAARTKRFIANNNITQKELSRLLKTDNANFNKFLNGQNGLSAETTLALVRLMNLSQRDLQLKFGAQDKTRARLMHLQVRGKQVAEELRFDDGWVSGQSGTDPVNSTSIIDTWKEGGEPSGDDILDVLREIDGIYAEARKAIANQINRITQAKVNKGPTSGPRYTPDNAVTSKPGPRGDKFSITSRQHLEFLQRQRQKAEVELAIQKEILAERKKELTARIELAEVKEKTVFSA
jgi:plasmid maintenance system antidote protein VapI